MSHLWGCQAILYLLLQPPGPVSVPTTTKQTRTNPPRSSATLHTKKTLGVSQSLAIQKILAYALQHNPGLRVAQSQLARAKARRKGAQAFPNNPVLSGGGGVQMPAQPGGPTGSDTLPRANVSLSLALPVGGRWGRTEQLAEAQVIWQQQVVAWQRYQLSIRVYQAINRAIFANLIWHKRKAIAAYFQEVERLTQQRIKHGSARPVDLPFVQASRLQAQQALLAAALQKRLMRQRLQALIGWARPTPMPWKLTASPSFLSPPTHPHVQRRLQQMQQKRQTKVQRHPRIAMAKAVIAMAKAGWQLARSRAIPDLTFSLGYALEDNQHIVQGTLSIPLPLFWRNQANVAQGKAQIQQATLALARVRWLLRQELQQATSRYRANQQMQQLMIRRAQTLKARSNMLERGLRQGGFSVFQVLTTQRSILDSQLLALQNAQDTNDSYIAMCFAAGVLPTYGSNATP